MGIAEPYNPVLHHYRPLDRHAIRDVFCLRASGRWRTCCCILREPIPPWYLTTLVFLGAGFLVTNLLVIHRVHVIFSNNVTVTILPFILLIIQMVSVVGLVYQFAKSHPSEQSIVLYSLSNPWVTTSLVTSMVISVYSTGMISWKIYLITGVLKKFSDRINGGVPLMSVLAIIVESAALQMAITIAALVTYHVGFVGQVVFSGISPVVIGISTILIHARIGLGWAHEPDAPSNRTTINLASPPDGALELELDDRRRKLFRHDH